MLIDIKKKRKEYLDTKEARRQTIEDSYNKIIEDGVLQSIDSDSIAKFERVIIANGVADIGILNIRTHSMLDKHTQLIEAYETNYGKDVYSSDVKRYVIKVTKDKMSGKSHSLIKLDNKVADKIKENLMACITKTSSGEIVQKGAKGTIGHGLMKIKGEDNV